MNVGVVSVKFGVSWDKGSAKPKVLLCESLPYTGNMPHHPQPGNMERLTLTLGITGHLEIMHKFMLEQVIFV